jgi:hypothetical protein
MMRQVRFTLWQMALIVLLVIGLATAVIAAIERVLPAWRFPGLLPLFTLVALDAVVTQRVVRRQRLSLSEQVPIRAAEGLLVVVMVRLASLGAEDATLSALGQLWLRDPLLVLGGSFALYLFPSILVWLVATHLAEAVLQFETDLPVIKVHGGAIDMATVVEDRTLAVAQFDRYWLLSALGTLICATVALYGMSLTAALLQWNSARTVLAVFVVLLAGLLLHSQGQFNQLSYGWQLDQVVVAPELAGRWRRSGTLLTGFALLLGALLGGLVLLIPPPPFIPILNLLLIISTMLLALVIALFGLLLLPIAWLLSLLTGREAPQLPQFQSLPPPQIVEPTGERPLLPALIFWFCVLLLVGVGVLRYLQQRYDILGLIGQWRGARWLLKLLGNLWSDTRTWGEYAVKIVRQRLQRTSPVKRVRRHAGGGPQAQLRAMYRRLIRAGTQRGVAHPPSQTPYEFRSALETAFPTTSADIDLFTEAIVEAEYGPNAPPPQTVRQARRHWQRALRVLGRSPGNVKGKLRIQPGSRQRDED